MKIKLFDALNWMCLRWQHFVHPYEEFYRLKQLVWNRLIDPIYQYKYKKEIKKPLIIKSSNFNYCKDYIHYFGHMLHQYSFYNINLNLNNTINWRLDYKNNIQSPLKFSNTIDKNDFNLVGELKIALEPSRLTFLPSYTFWYLCLDDVQKLKYYSPIQHIKDWDKQNPFMNSFNWSDGIEVGIRSINLTLTILIIHDLDNKLMEKHTVFFHNLIVRHEYFLSNHLSLYSSSNNHLIAELVGLITIHSAFSINKRRLKSVKKYFNLLHTYTPQQFFKDGFSKEQSTHYFKDVLSLYSLALSFVNRFNTGIDTSYLKNILKNSSFFFECLRINKNNYFDMGDNDGSIIIENLFHINFNEYESVRNDLAIIEGTIPESFDFRNYLLWGRPQSINSIYNVENKNVKKSDLHYFDTSKYLIYHKNGTHLLIDYSDLGYKYLGAHGHSDLMSFQLYVNSLPVFIDSGTYQYHSRFIKERNYFRSICAHNALSIDGNNHSKITSNMMWDKITSPEKVIYQKQDFGFEISGEFDFKYDRKHYRTYQLNEDKGELVIVDKVNSIGVTCNFELFFQINPLLEVKQTGKPFQYRIFTPSGVALSEIEIRATNVDVVFISGQKEPILGWYSEMYDILDKGLTLLISGTFINEKEIKSIIKII
jgi:hypothetical protein